MNAKQTHTLKIFNGLLLTDTRKIFISNYDSANNQRDFLFHNFFITIYYSQQISNHVFCRLLNWKKKKDT